jgi:hypothetical protein
MDNNDPTIRNAAVDHGTRVGPESHRCVESHASDARDLGGADWTINPTAQQSVR